VNAHAEHRVILAWSQKPFSDWAYPLLKAGMIQIDGRYISRLKVSNVGGEPAMRTEHSIVRIVRLMYGHASILRD
jgi:hypothetical protein